ncbi:MAG: hypothetical protein ABSG68_16305 [Thermoguttaceae bacterium]
MNVLARAGASVSLCICSAIDIRFKVYMMSVMGICCGQRVVQK